MSMFGWFFPGQMLAFPAQHLPDYRVRTQGSKTSIQPVPAFVRIVLVSNHVANLPHFEFIQQRIQLHPQATATEIAASLELDGLKASPEEVRQVMDQTQHTQEQIADFCFQQKEKALLG